MTNEEVVSEIKRDYITTMISKGKRIDGRDFNSPRNVTVEKDVISTAEGSARVTLGRTKVLVGIKVEIGRPFPDKPDLGMMKTSTELAPIASPTFDPGPPKPEAIELARVVDRGIREGECIDLKNLVIEEGEKVWMVYIDIHVLDYDGNLIDAAGLGALAALNTCIVKASKYGLGDDFKLPIKDQPVPVTVAKIGDTLLVDPGLDEERIADSRLTVTTDRAGNIRAMQKGFSGQLTVEEVKKAVGLSKDVGKALRKLV